MHLNYSKLKLYDIIDDYIAPLIRVSKYSEETRKGHPTSCFRLSRREEMLNSGFVIENLPANRLCSRSGTMLTNPVF